MFTTPTTTRPHLTRRGAVLVAMASAALVSTTLAACGGSSVAPAAGRPTAPPTTASTVTVPASPTTTATTAATGRPTSSANPTTPAPHPTPSDPSGIVWSQVGPGWSVVSSSSTAPDAMGKPNPGSFTLSMVSPTGVRYPLMTVKQAVSLQDVSPDGRRVMAFDRISPTPVLVEWDLAARTSHTIPLGAVSFPHATYSRPTGQQILVSDGKRGANRVLRMTRTGHVEATYATGANTPFVSTADGTRLVTTAPTGDSVVVLDNGTGRTVRTVASPSGYENCQPAQRWSGGDVELRCTVRDGQSMDLFAMSPTTGAVRALTHTDKNLPDELFGYVVAWPAAGGVLAERATGCGPGAVGLLDGSGRIGSELTWPGAKYPPAILGVAGTRVYAEIRSCGQTAARLVSQDVLTKRTTTLATAADLQTIVIQDR